MRTINKALFLDLDGTIIVTKTGKKFPKNKDDWQFNGNILKRIEEYVEKGYYIMIVSNQGGIEMGHVTLNDFRQKLRKITNEIIVQTGCPISRVGHRFTVTNNPEDFYRKPNPGMAYDLALAYILNLAECIMVGDASGKVRRKTMVFFNQDSPTRWSYEDESYVPIDKVDKIQENLGNTGYLIERDFSDSDAKFAKNAGMQYIDVEDFLNQQNIYEESEVNSINRA